MRAGRYKYSTCSSAKLNGLLRVRVLTLFTIRFVLWSVQIPISIKICIDMYIYTLFNTNPTVKRRRARKKRLVPHADLPLAAGAVGAAGSRWRLRSQNMRINNLIPICISQMGMHGERWTGQSIEDKENQSSSSYLSHAQKHNCTFPGIPLCSSPPPLFVGWCSFVKFGW